VGGGKGRRPLPVNFSDAPGRAGPGEWRSSRRMVISRAVMEELPQENRAALGTVRGRSPAERLGGVERQRDVFGGKLLRNPPAGTNSVKIIIFAG